MEVAISGVGRFGDLIDKTNTSSFYLAMLIPSRSLRSLGPPITSEMLERAAIRRGLPDLKAGARVKVIGSSKGVLVDSDYGENFEVILDDGRYVHVHPGDLKITI